MDGNRCGPEASPDISRAFERACLSPREAEAARSALAGMTAGEASCKMGVSPSSVGNYRARAYRKLGVKNSRELVDRFGATRPVGDFSVDERARARLQALGLSATQVDVAACILSGMTSRQIAEKLGIAEGTVNSSRSRMYATLGIHAKSELAELASQGDVMRASSSVSVTAVPRRIIFAVALALCCLSLLFGGWRLTHTRIINGVGFSVNLAGRSYGAYSDARIPDGVTGKSILDYCPDLIEVTALNGKVGYASAGEVIFGGNGPVPVYDTTGLQIIGST